ncbi:conjugal transfer mating pair stabilization protein TraN [Sphingomonas sp. BE138]|uniref:conjugal transfer protein TraN n=1 Tax=Sphingomonas sp. BE138 TaxID=2817845 RepID=UPI002863CE6A|nr:conjugal transfer protein TraN [Sphingomonas sp. BE138]MDR6790120.1 conjugal transfer mating pair stabilization protein TraN [Sphingomonas sp. BE138]
MRGARLFLVPAALALASAGSLLAQSGGQSTAQSGNGGYYDMGDYSYFSEPKTATPTPTPTPTLAPVDPVIAPARAKAASALSVTNPPDAASAQAAVEAQAQAQGQPYVFPKGDLAKAKADAKALATPARKNAASLPTSTPLTEVPGYSASANPAEAYADDPDALTAAGHSAAAGNEAWRMVTDPDRMTVKLAPGEIARAQDIEKDPNSFLDGQSLGSADGSCKPLPPSSGTDWYEATCNKGATVTDTPATCTGRMDPSVVNTLRYFYYGVRDQNEGNGFARNTVMQAKVQAGICRAEAATPHICDAQVELGAGGDDPASYAKWCKGLSAMRTTAQLYSCSAEIPASEIPLHTNYRTGTVWLRTEGTKSVTVTRNEGTCPAMIADTTCTATGPEVCTEGPETRMVDGVAVTQQCWAWSRPFTCQRITQSSDCSEIEANPKCTHVRDECLDDPQVGPCQVSTKVYRCPLPTPPASDPKQFICGDDVYCINGDCEPIEREASTEFKDAVVGLHVLGQANAEFNPDALSLFTGTRETCNKKIFGASNCCSGKGVPLLTPWLCSSAEKQLDEKDDKGLCHKLGSYCADKVLGICVTSKDAYCCFASKLTRILQEQGRPQISKPWGKPKDEKCKGFTLEEFQRLDLSVMDFSEVVSEFTDAAKLPDEIATSTMIQQRIKDYYEAKKP